MTVEELSQDQVGSNKGLRSGRKQPLLSPRETLCLCMVASGLRTKVIAYQLGLSGYTVDAHLGTAMRKLGMRTRASAAARAVRLGLVA